LEGDGSAGNNPDEEQDDPFDDSAAYDNNDAYHTSLVDSDTQTDQRGRNPFRLSAGMSDVASRHSASSWGSSNSARRRKSGSSTRSRLGSTPSSGFDNLALNEELAEGDADALQLLKGDIKSAIGGKNGSGVWLQPQRSIQSDSRSPSPASSRLKDPELGFMSSSTDRLKSRSDLSIDKISPIPTLIEPSSSRRDSFIHLIASKVKIRKPPSDTSDYLQDHQRSNIGLGATIEKPGPIDDGESSNPERLYGKSMGIFSPYNTYRVSCAKIVEHVFFTRLIKGLLFCQTGLLAYRQWNPRKLHGYFLSGTNWADWILFAINVIYTFDVIANMIAWGFWDDSQMFDEYNLPYTSFYELCGLKGLKAYFTGSPDTVDDDKIQKSYKRTLTLGNNDVNSSNLHRAYLRKTWNRIDFISSVFFWISSILSIKRIDADFNIPIFRALSCLRILRITSFTNRISLILESIKLGLPQLTDVFLFLTYFWCFFAIIGIQSFKASLRRFCVWTNPDDPNDTFVTSQYCGGYYEMVNEVLVKQPYIRDGIFGDRAKGFLCPVNSKCQTLENANGNTYGFDNILQSMQMTFVIMSGNTFSNIMYDTMDTDSMAAAFFFIFGIFFLLLWMINLLISVISESFKLVMEKHGLETKNNLDDFQLDWQFPKTIYSRIYLELKFVFEFLIIVSVTLLCLIDVDSSDKDIKNKNKAQLILSWIFFFEMVIRFILYFPNWRTFFTIQRNNFDLALAIITSVISTVVDPLTSERIHSWAQVFFLFRFYRVVIFVKFTRQLWAKVWRNISTIINLSLFYFLLLSLASIIFARYFENFADEDSIDDLNFPFHTLPNVFLGLFTVTSTENWSDIMFNLDGMSPNTAATFFSVLLFVVWFLLSNSLILNIFIAIIASSLSVSETEKRRKQVRKFVLVDFPRRLKALTEDSVLHGLRSKFFLKKKEESDAKHQDVQKLLLNGAAVEAFLKDELEDLEDLQNDTQVENNEQDSIHELKGSKVARFFKIQYRRILKYPLLTTEFVLPHSKIRSNPFYKKQGKLTGGIADGNFISLAERFRFATEKTEEERQKFLDENPSFNTSLFILHPRQPLRRLCQKIVSSSFGKRYDGVEPNRIANLIFTLIIATSTMLLIIAACYSTPLYKTNHDSLWVFYLEWAFGVLFMIEFAIKVVADGFLFTPNGYLRNIWNVIDFIVLVSIWYNLVAVSNDNAGSSSAVRSLKALRALRLLTISENAKDIFQKVMIAGFGKILGAAFVTFTLLFPFSVWGLRIFSGRLGVCNDGSLGQTDCINEYTSNVFNWDILAPRAYEQPILQFDDFPSSLSSLFQIISLEGWTDVLSSIVNSTGAGTPASPYASPWNAIFVCMFIFLNFIFIMTLFVSVIIHNYSSLTGSAFLTLEQTSWMETNKLLSQISARLRPIKVNLGRFRLFCFKYTVEKNKYVTATFHSLLWIHITAILLETYPSNTKLDNFRYSTYFMSSSAFLTFDIMKLIALGPRIFFSTKWNTYELFVFAGAFTTTFASFFISRNTVFANFNKLFLVGIFTVLIHISNRLNHLFKIVSASFPSLLSLVFTWFVLFLVYAIALNQIFGMTRLGPNTGGNLNVRTVPKALVLLFRDSFGEGWNYIMEDFSVEAPFCVDSDNPSLTDCGNFQYAYMLFISWNIISMYIFVNMFISLIFESFSYVYANNTETTSLNREEIRKFKTAWQRFDPFGTGFIDPEDLSDFMKTLDGYFAFRVFDGRWTIPEILKKWKTQDNPFSDDPYEIKLDIEGLSKMLDKLDMEKVQERKSAYERFIEEAIFNVEFYKEPGISFQRLILQIPLYARFNENNCLTLTDFLDRLVISRRITKRIQYRHHSDALNMIIFRWRFLKLRQPEKIMNYKPRKDSTYDYSGAGFATPVFNRFEGPFDGPNLDHHVVSEERYWSPSTSIRKMPFSDNEISSYNTDEDDILSMDEIAEGLENSQWRNEIKSTNEELEDFLGVTNRIRKKKFQDDQSSESSEDKAEGRKLA
jgi:hypothetical protein